MSSDFREEPGVAAILSPVVAVIKVGIDDKIAQVFFSTAALMEEYLALTKT